MSAIQQAILAAYGTSAFSPAVLWPLGASSPGMWIDPAYVAASFQDSAGTTALSAIGTVADSANPVGLILDRKAGATVLADPGLHLSQATSTARPLASARVNLLTKTEDFSDGVWVTDVGSLTKTVGQTDPDGGTTAARLQAAGGSICNFRYAGELTTDTSVRSVWIKSNTGAGGTIYIGDTQITLAADTEWHRRYVSEPSTYAWGFVVQWGVGDTERDVTIAFPQKNYGTTVADYQRVTSASDYDASVAPTYQQYDGTDDGMATVTVTADTVLTAGMDALIAIRRDSTANAVCGLYESVAEANKVFGIAQSGSGSGCVGSGAGTPTVWVDGVQLTGGTAVTRGTLHTALTVGDWHILEFRNLDLSTWTAAGFGLYTSYVFNGARGPIQLFATGQDANRDAARAEMAAYFGVTLP